MMIAIVATMMLLPYATVLVGGFAVQLIDRFMQREV
jgi:hypothetical protein